MGTFYHRCRSRGIGNIHRVYFITMPRSSPVLLLACVQLLGCVSLAAQEPEQDPALKLGMELYRSGDCPSAIPQLERSTNVARANVPLGRCYLEASEFGKAQAVFAKFRETAPGDEEG